MSNTDLDMLGRHRAKVIGRPKGETAMSRFDHKMNLGTVLGRMLPRPFVVASILLSGAWSQPAISAEGDVKIGQAKAIVRSVAAVGTDQTERKLKARNDVFADEVIITKEDSASKLQFLDDTELTVGPQSVVKLDKFVFDPNAGTEELVVNAAKGVARFVTGKMKKSAYKIITPTATIGVRGTTFTFFIINPNFDIPDVGVPNGLPADFFQSAAGGGGGTPGGAPATPQEPIRVEVHVESGTAVLTPPTGGAVEVPAGYLSEILPNGSITPPVQTEAGSGASTEMDAIIAIGGGDAGGDAGGPGGGQNTGGQNGDGQGGDGQNGNGQSGDGQNSGSGSGSGQQGNNQQSGSNRKKQQFIDLEGEADSLRSGYGCDC